MKNHPLFSAAFVLGALVVLWVAAGFLATNLLALTMTMVIGAVYVFGANELRQFRRATASLAAALDVLPPQVDNLPAWLDAVHPALRNAVRLRIEGERVGLPGPALTPYLAGLLVMLGMLGTFIGMVATFNGAVFALDGSTDLAAIRAAIAAPIKGLGLAFGTSVAGVAASAMLGLMAALARRERMQAGQRLDGKIASVLRGHSLTHQRQETYKMLQSQAQALPQVLDQLQMLMAQMARMNQQLGEQLSDRLLANQADFHAEMRSVYGELAHSVGQSLQDSLRQGAMAAGTSLKPVVEAAMTGIAEDARSMHARVADTVQQQLDGLAARFDASTTALLAAIDTAHAARIATEAAAAQQHNARLGELHGAVASHLTALGTALEAPIARLMETAAEAPRAAAELIGRLRQEISNGVARDNALLDERSRILETLNGLLASIDHASNQQRATIDALVTSAATALDQAGERFAGRIEAEGAKLSEAAAQVAGGAIDVASLGDAFGAAVQAFGTANAQLRNNLQRIEAALDKSMTRSDEQLAYYVAQAREVIDLSLASQKEIFDALRQLPQRQSAAGVN